LRALSAAGAAEEEDDCYVVCGEAGGGHCGWLVVLVGG
jgi:hypothetical protein